jgi:hypothetical protein
MSQEKLALSLTGYMRFKIATEWMKRGRPGEFEDFVKAVCEAKKLVYIPPQVKP